MKRPEDFEQKSGGGLELVYGLGKNVRKVKVEVLRASGAEPSLESIARC